MAPEKDPDPPDPTVPLETRRGRERWEKKAGEVFERKSARKTDFTTVSGAQVDPLAGPDSLARGPNLEGLFGRQVKLSDGRTIVADEAYIRESILNPAAKILLPPCFLQIGSELVESRSGLACNLEYSQGGQQAVAGSSVAGKEDVAGLFAA